MPERSPITVSIPEDFLLLTAQLPATTGGATVIDLPASRMGIKYAMTGAALMELGQRDRIETDLERLWLCETTPTGAAAVDPVLAHLVAKPYAVGVPVPIGDVIKELEPVDVYQRALDALKARGLVEDRVKRVLFLFNEHSWEVADPEIVASLRRRISGVLFEGVIPDPRDACLLSLIEATKKFQRVVEPERVQEAVTNTKRYANLDLVGRNVAMQVSRLIEALGKYGDIV